jgi:hypothetical protein
MSLVKLGSPTVQSGPVTVTGPNVGPVAYQPSSNESLVQSPALSTPMSPLAEASAFNVQPEIAASSFSAAAVVVTSPAQSLGTGNAAGVAAAVGAGSSASIPVTERIDSQDNDAILDPAAADSTLARIDEDFQAAILAPTAIYWPGTL